MPSVAVLGHATTWWSLSDGRGFGEKFPTRWGPSSLAKLVNITPISLWFMVSYIYIYNYSIHGGYVHQLTWGFGEKSGFELITINMLVGGLENDFYFSIYWEESSQHD